MRKSKIREQFNDSEWPPVSARNVEMIYAPFDHINTSARVVIVDKIPGRFRAANALRAARKALLDGRTVAGAAAAAKTFASFLLHHRHKRARWVASILEERLAHSGPHSN